MKLFSPPVGTIEERKAGKVWPGLWVDATGYAVQYPPSMGRRDYHTGADLNLNAPHFDSDREAPVYAVADGLVVCAAVDTVWGKGNAIICIHHTLPTGTQVWTRYAHVKNLLVKLGDGVERGQQIAQIGNGGGRYPYHLHFDVALIDLGASPGDWPNADYARVIRSYADPQRWIQEM